MGVSGQHHAPAALYPGERNLGTHCTGGWVGPRAGLDVEARRKIPCLCRGSNPGRLVLVRHYTDRAIPTPKRYRVILIISNRFSIEMLKN
jgi:hypothetical protein